MAQSHKHLITLKLILKTFGFNLDEILIGAAYNEEIMQCCIAILQTIYPLNYNFEIIKIGSRHSISSIVLQKQIKILISKANDGEFGVLERKFILKDILVSKIETVLKHVLVPNNIEISQLSWIFLLGFYSVAKNIFSHEEIVNMFTNEYRNFLPYLDIANEKLMELKSNE